MAWQLPDSEAVNAALASYPRDFEVWEQLAARPIAELVAEGAPILRANRVEIERALRIAHPVAIGERRARGRQRASTAPDRPRARASARSSAAVRASSIA